VKTFLKIYFSCVILAIIYVTVTATMERGVVTAMRDLWPDAWFRATMADTYFAFLAVFLFVCYKERGAAARVFWFLAIMILGNLAIAPYMLIQLAKLKKEDPVEKIFLR